MLLSQLFAPLLDLSASDDCEISGIAMDSREVKPGYLFMAASPPLGDGEPYIPQAIAAGAVAILQQGKSHECIIENAVRYVKIPDVAAKIGEIAASFCQNPSRQVPVYGVTGTNGKTTISYLLAQALTILGKPAGLIGTIG